jgi:hypothetical protein
MKTSDLTLSVIVVFIFILLYLFNILVVGIQRIKENWPVYRCQPLVMPFASIFGHDSSKNFGYCIANMQKNFMGPLLKPLNFNISLLGDITGGLTSGLNSNRDFVSKFRASISGTFMNIFSVVFNVMIEVQRTVINVKDMINKLVGIMTTTLYILNGSIMTMESAWAGPPGQLVKALCFHPDTKLKLQSGEIISMQNIPLNSVLQNGTRVCATMQISNLDENSSIIEKMYRVKRKKNIEDIQEDTQEDILVSGSHLIYDPNIKQFVHVKDLPSSELTEINCEVLSCLITSDHTIPIGEWIFHDWEDSNGSAPKNIGKKQ